MAWWVGSRQPRTGAVRGNCAALAPPLRQPGCNPALAERQLNSDCGGYLSPTFVVNFTKYLSSSATAALGMSGTSCQVAEGLRISQLQRRARRGREGAGRQGK